LLENADKTIHFKGSIRKVCATNENCWILLEGGGEVFGFNFTTKEEMKIATGFDDISCTSRTLYGIKNNSLYEFSSENEQKLHEFPKHQKIKKFVSGVEHLLILTTNGDVFSSGCGLRGALGHGDVNSHEIPLQIEALAGLKIVDISAGSFHSAAVSSFGDVYTWGWNTNGQLGLPKVAEHTFEKASESHQQVYTTPQLIDLDDDNDAVAKVFCGSKHTILRTERNRLFAAGLNNYGQLGLSSDVEDIGKFTEMPVKMDEHTKVSCGYWSTFLIDRIK
jgi:alpha-tubulin suppressor-like RCC1 family protein